MRVSPMAIGAGYKIPLRISNFNEMKTKLSLYLIIGILFLTTNFTKDENEVGEAPDLPALETMALDFSTFTDNEIYLCKITGQRQKCRFL